MNSDPRFKYLFWFCVGVFTVSFAAMMTLLFCEIPDKNREMASNTQGFLQGSLIMSSVGFLLTGNINQSKKTGPATAGTVTGELSFVTETESKETPKDNDPPQ